MTQIAQMILSLIRLGVGTAGASDNGCAALLNLPMEQWRQMMALAERQGVAAVAFDGVQKLYDAHQKDIRAAKDNAQGWMQMVFGCTGTMTQYEQMNLQQQKVIRKVADLWKKDGISMMVFKGQANGSFYPKPLHRASGDIDCYLFGEADKGDQLLADKGAAVENKWYRHSKISYQGETIENHRVLSHTRGSKTKKRMEKELVALLNSTGMSRIEGCGEALQPPAQFNAHFLIYHALHHFTSEGLKLKQILDWAVFLHTQQDNVDWQVFNDFCQRYRLDRFAAVMNYIAEYFLGVECHTDSTDNTVGIGEWAEKVLQSTLYDDDYLFNSGKSDWTVRWLLVRNMLGRDRWKYEDIAQENIWSHLWHSATGFLMEKD